MEARGSPFHPSSDPVRAFTTQQTKTTQDYSLKLCFSGHLKLKAQHSNSKPEWKVQTFQGISWIRRSSAHFSQRRWQEILRHTWVGAFVLFNAYLSVGGVTRRMQESLTVKPIRWDKHTFGLSMKRRHSSTGRLGQGIHLSSTDERLGDGRVVFTPGDEPKAGSVQPLTHRHLLLLSAVCSAHAKQVCSETFWVVGRKPKDVKASWDQAQPISRVQMQKHV